MKGYLAMVGAKAVVELDDRDEWPAELPFEDGRGPAQRIDAKRPDGTDCYLYVEYPEAGSVAAVLERVGFARR
jgi:hypothetical protein